MVLDKLGDRDAFAHWFASHVTTPKYDTDTAVPGDPADPATRAAYIRRGDGTRVDYANGHRVDNSEV